MQIYTWVQVASHSPSLFSDHTLSHLYLARRFILEVLCSPPARRSAAVRCHPGCLSTVAPPPSSRRNITSNSRSHAHSGETRPIAEHAAHSGVSPCVGCDERTLSFPRQDLSRRVPILADLWARGMRTNGSCFRDGLCIRGSWFPRLLSVLHLEVHVSLGR
ncbi:hypothetical protein FKP32DRAFT_246632 [Trametes sanguinea]|nr:hypothetical protein FKP32DRAFT_246632 [Trametes sanguinea]